MDDEAKKPAARRPVAVRFSTTEWAVIEAAAGEAASPPTTYVRERALGCARRELGRSPQARTAR